MPVLKLKTFKNKMKIHAIFAIKINLSFKLVVLILILKFIPLTHIECQTKLMITHHAGSLTSNTLQLLLNICYILIGILLWKFL